MGIMMNDKRIEELQQRIQARDKVIASLHEKIRKLEAENGILQRSVLIAYEKLSDRSKEEK